MVALIWLAKKINAHEDGRTAPGVWGSDSVPLSHSGNVITRIGIHTHSKCSFSEKVGMELKVREKVLFNFGTPKNN